jgi:hypothetical protein
LDKVGQAWTRLNKAGQTWTSLDNRPGQRWTTGVDRVDNGGGQGGQQGWTGWTIGVDRVDNRGGQVDRVGYKMLLHEAVCDGDGTLFPDVVVA